MYKQYYSRFLSADSKRLHFAAHSHHPWPDCTREAQIQYWDDSTRLMDQKWEHVFGQVVPEAQQSIAKIIGVSVPSQICFAPNTHEFVCRLLSCFDPKQKIRILTTDSEFHSMRRQMRRYEEDQLVQVSRVSTDPWNTFEERFFAEASRNEYDLVFLSNVFFNSGFAIKDLEKIVRAVKSKDSLVVIDGYHSFMALPTSLKNIEDRVFFLGGGYKYAQAGEGACFMYIPPTAKQRPLNTGWYASFSTLEEEENKGKEVTFDNGAFRFWGATFDPSGLYRLNAIFRWMHSIGLTVDIADQYVKTLQAHFISGVEEAQMSALSNKHLLMNDLANHGHFLTYRFPEARKLCHELKIQNIITDIRGDRIRFGFGVYQTLEDVDVLLGKLGAITL